MLTRAVAFALFLSVAACSPEPQSTEQTQGPGTPEMPSATAANPAAAALGEAMPGQWFFSSTETPQGTRASAAFGDPETEAIFQFNCEPGEGTILFQYYWDETAPQQNAIQIITASLTIEVPARGEDLGIPIVFGSLPATDARLDALAAPQTRFGAAIAGMTGVLPWEEGIARTLAACGV